MNNMDKIIASASEKLGVKPDVLKKSLESGNINDIFASMNSEDAKKMKSILENKAMIDKLMKSPQAVEMMKRLNKK